MSQHSKQQRAERAAAALHERQRKERRRQILSVVGVVLAMVLVVGGGFVVNSLRDNSDESAAAAPDPGSDLGLTIGETSAPHQVVIYEDFLCPFCGDLEAATHGDLEQLAQDGTVQVEYRPAPFLDRFGPYSQAATEAFAVTVEQSTPEVALALHDLLFANQPSEEGPFPSEDDLAELMSQAGADDATVQAYRDGDGEKWAKEAIASATDLEIGSTPTIIVDGEPFNDGRTIEQLAANLLAAVD